MAHPLTTFAYVLHVSGGMLALVSGTTAAFAPKGGRTHRAAGNLFVVAMLTMAAFAIYLAFVIPDQLLNVVIGTFTIYLVATGWLTVHRPSGWIGLAEKGALGVAAILCAPFAILSFQLATGSTPLFRSAMAFEGPLLIVIYAFTAVLAIAFIGDAQLVFAGGTSGPSRIARHLWRMCLGLALASGSAFTNGFARLLPGRYHVPPAFFLPQFLPLVLLVFWLFRVRFTAWFARSPQRLRRSPDAAA